MIINNLLNVLQFVVLTPLCSIVKASPIQDEHNRLRTGNTTGGKSPFARAYPMYEGWTHLQQASLQDAFDHALFMAANVLAYPHRDEIYPIYFQGDEDYEKVMDVFREIVGREPGDIHGAAIFKNILIDGLDRKKSCQNDPNNVLVAALLPGRVDRTIANIVCCEKCWNYPHMEDGIDCDDLGTTVSVKMSSLGGVILHELVHFDPMCVPSIGQQTEDIAWGPLSVRKLRQNEPEKACLNADNYKWYAQHLWWTVNCDRKFSGPRGSIDTYEPWCGIQGCQIQ